MKSEFPVSDIWSDETHELTLSVAWGIDNPLYGELLWVRNQVDRLESPPVWDFDPYSYHYCLRHESVPIGSLSVTRNVDGPIDCREFYPECLFEAFGERIASTCKFRILSHSLPQFWTLRQLLRESWRYQQEAGMRMDLVNAERSFIRFYSKIGYREIDGTRFCHPLLGTDSVALYMPTDANHGSFMQDICRAIDDPIRHEDVQEVLVRNETQI